MIELKDRGAWFGDPLLKERTVALMKRHRELDHFLQGDYQTLRSPSGIGFKGCAVGCLVETSELGWVDNSNLMLRYDGDDSGAVAWHLAVQEQFGIPAPVAAAIDGLFEHQDDFEAAGDFAVAVVEAIPVGADLSAISAISNHTCDWYAGWCETCSAIDKWHDDSDLFIKDLANAPLVPAARALILVG